MIDLRKKCRKMTLKDGIKSRRKGYDYDCYARTSKGIATKES